MRTYTPGMELPWGFPQCFSADMSWPVPQPGPGVTAGARLPFFNRGMVKVKKQVSSCNM